MKISEILPIKEGVLRGNWTIDDIVKLKPKNLEALINNATKVNDQKVLGLIKRIQNDREENVKTIAAQKKKQRADSREATAKATKEQLGKLANKIQEVVGSTFPDGDPIDILGPYVIKMFGVKDFEVISYLDKAVKLIGKDKDYYDYLAAMWDEYAVPVPDIKVPKNPWKKRNES